MVEGIAVRKAIPGWPQYEVSDDGRVFSPTRELKPIKGGTGYLWVALRHHGKRTNKNIHALVLLAFVGPRAGLVSRHLNGIRTDNRLTNLTYGTHAENSGDMRAHGTAPIGENNANSKLTAAQVREIRAAHASGKFHWGARRFASQYGVTEGHVRDVAHGLSWRHV